MGVNPCYFAYLDTVKYECCLTYLHLLAWTKKVSYYYLLEELHSNAFEDIHRSYGVVGHVQSITAYIYTYLSYWSPCKCSDQLQDVLVYLVLIIS